jgi:hypothetical protein
MQTTNDNELQLKIAFILQLNLEMRSEDQLQTLAEFMQSKRFFQGIDDIETIIEISKHIFLEIYQKDDYIFKKGQMADKFYILLNGQVAAYDMPASEL